MKTLRLALTAVFAIGLSSCATIEVHSDDTSAPYPYAGTTKAVKKTGRSVVDYSYYGEVFVRASDVPLCLIADTLLLPYDVYRVLADD